MLSYSLISPALTALCLLGFLYFLQRSGQLSDLITWSTQWNIGRRMKMIGILLTVGFLPVKNKAILVAPILLTAGDKLGLQKEKCAWASFFASHLHYMTSPLSMSLAMALVIGKVGFGETFMAGLWFPVGLLLAITISLVRFEPNSCEEKTTGKTTFGAGYPLLTFVGLTFFGLNVILASFLSLFVALCEAILSRRTMPRLQQTLAEMNWTMIAVIAMLSVVGYLLKNTPWFFQVAGELPMYLCGIAIGIACGSSTAAVVSTFALFGSLIQEQPLLVAKLYMACWAGYMISPVHNCVAITSLTFNVPTWRLYLFNAVTVLLSLAAILIL